MLDMARSGLAAILAFLSFGAAGQQALEIIALRHRTVEQVLPVLRPLLEPGATLTGQRGQLIVRTSPANLAELRRALDAIDRPLRRLQISVRFDDRATSQAQEVGADGRISNRGARIGVHAREQHSQSSERVDQKIQVLEGARAFIMAGRSVPVPGGVWETATGFEAVPRLSGDTVLVDIAPQQESLERQQRMATTVSARLGEWFQVGGALSGAEGDERGIASRSTSRSAESRSVWLKVEELRP
jgi:hypothetical protein